MLHYLLLFLGFKTWNVNFPIVKKKHVNMLVSKPMKNIKRVVENVLNHDFTPSPIGDTFINIHISTVLNNKLKIFYSIYVLYSLIVFMLLSVQPSYLIIKMKNNFSQEVLITFLMNSITPLNYVWGKWYFQTNHYEYIVKCEKCNVIVIVSTTIVLIIAHFLDTPSFNNDFYWIFYIRYPLNYILIIIFA